MKNTFTICVTIFLLSTNAFSQPEQDSLAVADSLFTQQKYTQSFEIYESIYTSSEQVSPSMLLKMSYIKEGLGDYTQALVYLNRYYLATSNDLALERMNDLAEGRDLKGFGSTEGDYLVGGYYSAYPYIVIVLGIIGLLLLGLSIYQKFKKKNPKPVALISLICFAALWVLINFGLNYNKGVVTKNYVYVMTAPSSSSDVIEVISKGHRVDIIDEQDVWLRIMWEGQEGYVKEKTVEPLSIW